MGSVSAERGGGSDGNSWVEEEEEGELKGDLLGMGPVRGRRLRHAKEEIAVVRFFPSAFSRSRAFAKICSGFFLLPKG